jgi:hypothetical protein
MGQPPVPGGNRPPAFSPYLNLFRGGSPAINYYGLIRPELQFRQAIQSLNNDLTSNQNAINNLESGLGVVTTTGHPTQFMNLGGYFMNSGMGAQGLGGGSQSGARMNTINNRPGPLGGAGQGAPPPRR